jgi:hypothetical protein
MYIINKKFLNSYVSLFTRGGGIQLHLKESINQKWLKLLHEKGHPAVTKATAKKTDK